MLETALLLGLLAMVSSQDPHQAAAAPEVGIDHVILAIDDLQRGIEGFARATGVRPEFGGEHPGRGTANALVSLGQGRYLEILAPASPAGQPAKLDASWGDAFRHKALTPVGWALHSRDLARTVTQVRKAGIAIGDPQPGSRKRPDGATLTWKTATLEGPQLDLHPFFIEWTAGTAHPSTTAPAGCELVRVAITAPEPANLKKLLQTVGVEVEVQQGAKAAMAFTLRCAKGEVTFPAAG
ncbi:MAG TPA: VOC family protein [Thermoanaerobaculia bacterium]